MLVMPQKAIDAIQQQGHAGQVLFMQNVRRDPLPALVLVGTFRDDEDLRVLLPVASGKDADG